MQLFTTAVLNCYFSCRLLHIDYFVLVSFYFVLLLFYLLLFNIIIIFIQKKNPSIGVCLSFSAAALIDSALFPSCRERERERERCGWGCCAAPPTDLMKSEPRVSVYLSGRVWNASGPGPHFLKIDWVGLGSKCPGLIGSGSRLSKK